MKFSLRRLVFLALLLLIAHRIHGKMTTHYTLPNVSVVPIEDGINQRQYQLYIKLPEGYENAPEKHYPVLYFTDAKWHIELLSAATEYSLKDIILVGISWQLDQSQDPEYMSRYRDYTAFPSANVSHQKKYQFGHAAEHLRFIQSDVFTYVEKHYRVIPQQRAYFGYSLGAEFGAYTLLNHEETFRHYILGSPYVDTLLDNQSSPTEKHTAMLANVYVAYGKEEESEAQRVNSIKAFISLLNQQKSTLSHVRHEVLDGNHTSAFPITGVRSIAWLSEMLKLAQSQPNSK